MLLWRPWSSTQDQVSHFRFLGGTDAIQSVGRKCPDESVASDGRETVGEVAKLGEQIQNARRLRPSERQMAAELRTCEVGDEESVGGRGVRWRGSELVTPQTNLAAAAHLPGNQADRIRPFAWQRDKLEIHEPDFPETIQAIGNLLPLNLAVQFLHDRVVHSVNNSTLERDRE